MVCQKVSDKKSDTNNITHLIIQAPYIVYVVHMLSEIPKMHPHLSVHITPTCITNVSTFYLLTISLCSHVAVRKKGEKLG